ncbi:hypothetical protein CANINC_004972 [Pichia inconspicua]|uniref:Uncharacterized protein n=1 Tax=Pichia inconspicua TaxID=52247 RepID=A0A4T0WUS4_9ASCO|nr:hypothetical protein CANINC_004972 [[Candida] inconspicua]
MNHIENSYTTGEKTHLYGGAVSVQLPAGLLDASHVRPVPDTQEVFVAATTASSVLSIIVDLLECVPGTTLDEIVDAHAKELGLETGTAISTIAIALDTLSEPLAELAGIRVFAATSSRPTIALGVLRLRAPAKTDVVITVTGGAATAEGVAEVARNVVASFVVESPALFA